jgi:hypothetical protein
MVQFSLARLKKNSRLNRLLGLNISSIMAQDFGAAEATKAVEQIDTKRISWWRSDRRKWITFWILWLAVIVCATTMPWSNFKGHSHWGLVRWIPFGDHPLVLSDIVANVALFLPLGYFYFIAMPLSSRRATILWGLMVSALLSGGAEFF